MPAVLACGVMLLYNYAAFYRLLWSAVVQRYRSSSLQLVRRDTCKFTFDIALFYIVHQGVRSVAVCLCFRTWLLRLTPDACLFHNVYQGVLFDLCAMSLHAHAAIGLPLAPMYVRRVCCAVPRGASTLCVDCIFGWIHRMFRFRSTRLHRRLFASSAAYFFCIF